PGRRCLRFRGYSCCCEADYCCPDCRVRSVRSVLPVLQRLAEFGRSLFFTSFQFWYSNLLCRVDRPRDCAHGQENRSSSSHPCVRVRSVRVRTGSCCAVLRWLSTNS